MSIRDPEQNEAVEPEPKRRQYRNGAEQRARIVRAAIQLFGRKGFNGASLREIAASAGISLPGLQHHFPTKEALLKEILMEREAVEAREVLFYNAIPWQEASIRKQRANESERTLLKLWSLSVAESTDVDHPLHAHFIERYRDFRRLIASGMAAGDGRALPFTEDFLKSALLVAAWDGLQTQWLLDDSFDMKPAFDYLIVMLSRYNQYEQSGAAESTPDSAT